MNPHHSNVKIKGMPWAFLTIIRRNYVSRNRRDGALNKKPLLFTVCFPDT